eukprot:4000330-Pleurochrysis_carterae.AAC.2
MSTCQNVQQARARAQHATALRLKPRERVVPKVEGRASPVSSRRPRATQATLDRAWSKQRGDAALLRSVAQSCKTTRASCGFTLRVHRRTPA